MHYCINCGNKIENEKDLCELCGADVGELIRLKENKEKQNVEKSKGKLDHVWEDFKKILKGFFKDPLGSLKTLSESLNKGNCLIGIIIVSLLGAFINKLMVNLSISKLKIQFEKSLNEALTGRNRAMGQGVDFSYIYEQRDMLLKDLESLSKGKLFFQSFLFHFALIFLISLVIYAIIKFLMKKNYSYFTFLNIAFISVSLYVIIKITTYILLNISNKLSMVFFAIAMLALIIINFILLAHNIKEEENKILLSSLLTYLISTFFVSIYFKYYTVAFWFSKVYGSGIKFFIRNMVW